MAAVGLCPYHSLPVAQFKYGAELGAPGDEYNKSPYGEGSPRLLKDKTQLPTVPCSEMKLLGVLIDSDSNFSKHIAQVCRKAVNK